MSRYRIEVNQRAFEVTLLQRTHNSVQFSVNGREYQVSIAPHSLPVAVQPAAAATAVPAPSPRQAQSASDGRSIVAPMPGIVLRVPVKVGEELSPGQVAVVIEAMKMENNIAAPSRARVKEILVQEGAEVDGRQALIQLEPLA